MISHVWTVLCQKAIIDNESNNVSLLEVLESLQLTLLEPFDRNKALPIAFSVVSLWERTPDSETRASMRVSFVSPVGDPMRLEQLDIDFKDRIRLRTIIKTHGIPLSGSGIYHFVVELQHGDDWQRCAAVPLEIQVTQANEPTAQPTPQS